MVHGSGEAERFYRQLSGPALIGMESTGNHQWFLEMVTPAGHELWVGDAAKIRARLRSYRRAPSEAHRQEFLPVLLKSRFCRTP